MRRALIVLVAGMVLFGGCFGGSEAPERCADRSDADCIVTRRVAGVSLVFDVPVGAPVRAFYVEHVNRSFWGPPHPLWPLPLRRLESESPRQTAGELLAFTHVPTGSVLNVRPGDGRWIYRDPSSSNEVIFQFQGIPTARFRINSHTLGPAARFPLDRVTILPDVHVSFVRTPADALFDQILASIRVGIETRP